MRLLVDSDIRSALQAPIDAAVAYVMDGDPPQPQLIPSPRVRRASLDLTIGEIFVPGSDPEDPGGSENPKKEHSLEQGHTAVIRTRQHLRMGPSRAAIAFPPAHISRQGLLMTNPGHIDPGYEGPLHCTVINMGHERYFLSRNLEIMRVLFFALDDGKQLAPSSSDVSNTPDASSTPTISTDLLTRLSTDFLDVERRAESIANGAVSRATLIATGIPLAVALITVLGAFFFPPLETAREDIATLKQTAATKADEKDDIHRLDTGLQTLKAQIDTRNQFDDRLRALENKVNALIGAH